MPRLPDAHGRSVRLNLIDVAPFNPHRLTLDDGLLDDRRLLNNDRLRVIRTRQRRPDNAANPPMNAPDSRPHDCALIRFDT